MKKSLKKAWRLAFPAVPPSLEPSFSEQQRRLARKISVVAALVLVLIIPFFQIIEACLLQFNRELLQQHAFLRAPLFFMALIVFALRYWFPDGQWPRPVLLLMGTALITLPLSLLLLDYLQENNYFPSLSSGLVMSIAAVSILATRGAKDLFIMFGIPSLFFLAGLFCFDVLSQIDSSYFMYPLMMIFISFVIAQLQYQYYVQGFMLTEELSGHAMTDHLTGLLNRRAIHGLLETENAKAKRHGRRYAVILADLDFFKKVNDEHGHDVGDQVLVELAQRLQGVARKEDHVSRWGGEEFLLLLQDASGEMAMTVAEKIRLCVSEAPFRTNAGELSITISLGVALWQEENSAEHVIVRADEALYEAKARGRNMSVRA